MTRTAHAHTKRPRQTPALLPEIVRAVLDAREESIAVFDREGEAIYLNAPATAAYGAAASHNGNGLRARMLASRGRAVPLDVGGSVLGEILIVPNNESRLWEHREREAIQETLARSRGKRGEAARQLGISRTTLWRRLRDNPAVAREWAR